MNKETLHITGVWDGNIFSVIGSTKKLLKKKNVSKKEIERFVKECYRLKTYGQALEKCMTILESVGFEIE